MLSPEATAQNCCVWWPWCLRCGSPQEQTAAHLLTGAVDGRGLADSAPWGFHFCRKLTDGLHTQHWHTQNDSLTSCPWRYLSRTHAGNSERVNVEKANESRIGLPTGNACMVTSSIPKSSSNDPLVTHGPREAAVIQSTWSFDQIAEAMLDDAE